MTKPFKITRPGRYKSRGYGIATVRKGTHEDPWTNSHMRWIVTFENGNMASVDAGGRQSSYRESDYDIIARAIPTYTVMIECTSRQQACEAAQRWLQTAIPKVRGKRSNSAPLVATIRKGYR